MQLLAAAGAEHHLPQGLQVGFSPADAGGFPGSDLMLLRHRRHRQQRDQQQKPQAHRYGKPGREAVAFDQQVIVGIKISGQM